MKPQPDNSAPSRDLVRLMLGVASGSLAGALVGGAAAGYMQLLEETAALRPLEMQWVALAAFVGGFGGATAGAAVGLVAALALVVRGGAGAREAALAGDTRRPAPAPGSR